MLEYERQAWESGHRLVAGVDEAGRGPLAGPVAAAAVVLEPAFLLAEQTGLLQGLTDSKKLSATRRRAFLDLFRSAPSVQVSVAFASVQEIDGMNILRATHLAMGRAVNGLPRRPDLVLIDGLPVREFPAPSRAVVGGDGKSFSIAAASVAAKVARDEYMVELAERYPMYGFARNKGYGTRRHLEALHRHGPCPHHRRTFSPVRQLQLAL
jgi:ribonuclease HII